MGSQFAGKGVGSVKSLVDRGLAEIPEAYIHPENDRVTATPIYSQSIPFVDLQGLHGANRQHTVNAISKACQDWGVFQVVNHGVSERVMEKMMAAHHRFFELPEVEKRKFKGDHYEKPVAYSTSLSAKNKKFRNWNDFLKISIPRTVDPNTVECWPEIIRDAALEYTAEVKKLGLKLLSALSESLGVPCVFLQNMIGHERLLLNYYPPCPNPEMTFGQSKHSDVGLLTILLQDDVGGLQVSHQGRWVAVHPIPNAFVVNVGDTLQILTNSRFQSVEHRAIPSDNRVRISISFFCAPDNSAVIRPMPEIINENNPAKYKSFTFGEYWSHCRNKSLPGKAVNLAFAKLS